MNHAHEYAWIKDTNKTLSDGLVSYWPLEKAALDAERDLWGHNDLIPEGSGISATSTNVLYMPYGTAFAAAGVYRISDANQIGLDFASQDFSYSLWTRKMNAAGTPSAAMVARDKIGSRCFIIQNNENAGDATTLVAVNDVIKGSTTMQYATWTHIAVTFDYVGAGSSITRIYKDGVCVSTTTNSNGMCASTGDLQIGGREYSTSRIFYNGGIMHVGAWSKTLNQWEIKDLYNNGKGNPLSWATTTQETITKYHNMPTSTAMSLELAGLTITCGIILTALTTGLWIGLKLITKGKNV